VTRLFVCVHPSDNVGIIVDPEGAAWGFTDASGLILQEKIPQSHKLSLRSIERGEPVLRYGHEIGRANRQIPAGCWVREEMIDLPEPPPLDSLSLSTAVPPPLNYSFDGFANRNGSTGTKNILGITTTVQCVAPTVDLAARRVKTEILPRYPNVDDVVAITHGYGCGVAIDAAAAAIPIRTLKNISLHANVAAQPLVVSLGCEKLRPERLFRSDLPILEELDVIRLQDEHGFSESIGAIMY
jgi:galactarate dehydratase